MILKMAHERLIEDMRIWPCDPEGTFHPVLHEYCYSSISVCQSDIWENLPFPCAVRISGYARGRQAH